MHPVLKSCILAFTHTDCCFFSMNNTNTDRANESKAYDVQTEATQLYAVSVNGTHEVRIMHIHCLLPFFPFFLPAIVHFCCDYVIQSPSSLGSPPHSPYPTPKKKIISTLIITYCNLPLLGRGIPRAIFEPKHHCQ